MDLLMHVSAYDIQCQYRINFVRRMEEFDDLRLKLNILNIIPAKLFPWTVAGVGKFHLAGHVGHCRYKFSFNFLPGVGQVDGEAPERVWPGVNAVANRTREMNPGNRHDNYNDHYNDQNAMREHKMRAYLSGIFCRPPTNRQSPSSGYSGAEIPDCRQVLTPG